MLALVVADNTLQLLVGLGARRPLLVPADRALVGGEGRTPTPRSRRSSPPAPATSAFMIGIIITVLRDGGDDVEHPAINETVCAAGTSRPLLILRCAAAAAVRRHHRQVGPVPAAHLAARRDGRPDAGVGADPRGDDGRRRRLPRSRALPGVLPRRLDRAGGIDRDAIGGDHGPDRRRCSRSSRTTSRRCWRTRRSASSATW